MVTVTVTSPELMRVNPLGSTTGTDTLKLLLAPETTTGSVYKWVKPLKSDLVAVTVTDDGYTVICETWYPAAGFPLILLMTGKTFCGGFG
jgi:hypothetical protein